MWHYLTQPVLHSDGSQIVRITKERGGGESASRLSICFLFFFKGLTEDVTYPMYKTRNNNKIRAEKLDRRRGRSSS